ncbi:hypothetical protein BC940DRAFT_321533 [Gongronella butleri]|nr:hypothetical protein BC940DRAFT_321533 [Gongronella butleri]
MDAYRQSSLERVSLPAEIVIAILKFLPRKNLIQLRGTICRVWCDFITPIVFDTLYLRDLRDPQNGAHRASTEEEHQAFARRNELKTQTEFRETWLSSDSATAMGEGANIRHCVRTVLISGSYLQVSDVESLLRQCPNVNSMVIHVSFLSTVNWRLYADGSAHAPASEVPLTHHLYQYALDDRLTDAIAPMFAAAPKLDRLKVPGAIHAPLLLTHLPLLRHLDLHAVLARVDSRQFMMDTGLDQIDVIQRLCPNLESVKVGGFDISKYLTPNFCQTWHSPGHDPSCIACRNPWPSVTCLQLSISRQTNSADEVPALMAYICVKFPNLTHLDLRVIGSGPPSNAAPTNSWRTMLDMSIAYLPKLVSCTFHLVNPKAIAALYHFTVAQHASRSTLESLKIFYNQSDGRINLLDLLSTFRSLQSLHLHCYELVGQHRRARGGNAPVLDPADLPEPPMPYHPLRSLCLTSSVPLPVLIAVSKMCRDLTSALLMAGYVVHPLPSSMAAALHVEPLLEFGQKNPVYWLTLPYSTRLKKLVINCGKANAIFASTTPRMIEDGNGKQAEDAALDDTTDQDTSTGACGAWLVQRQGKLRKIKNVQSLGPYATWLVDNLTFRSGQKKRQEDAGVTSSTISALNAARRTGIIAILLPSQPRIRLLQDNCSVTYYAIPGEIYKMFTLW